MAARNEGNVYVNGGFCVASARKFLYADRLITAKDTHLGSRPSMNLEKHFEEKDSSDSVRLRTDWSVDREVDAREKGH
jgi:hypothetical protein